MIVAVIGTRPEVIKMAPVIHALRRCRLAVQVVTTGQHHDARMMGSFLESFGLEVDHTLGLSRRDLLGSFVEIVSALGEVFEAVKPRLALAVGDTTTVLATGLVARKTGSAFGHVEAGLRAFSRELPEEEHRICADALGDLLFTPTRTAGDNLRRERVNGTVIFTGNPILDALQVHAPASIAPDQRRGILVTVHRQETVDDPERLADVLAALRALARIYPVDWPLHPRTRAKIAEHRLELPPDVRVTEPIGHRQFLDRLMHARVVVTDSGGAQEEAAILGTPCVCVRNHTERPETIEAGVGLLAGTTTRGIMHAVGTVLASWASFARAVPHLYGDGRAGERIATACAEYLARPSLAPPRVAVG